MKDKLLINRIELVDYLKITSKLLNVTKSKLDVEKLKSIIKAIESDKYEITDMTIAPEPSIKDVEKKIIKYLTKSNSGIKGNKEDEQLFEEYSSKNNLLILARKKAYDELYSIMTSRERKSKNEVSILYLYCIGDYSKSMTLQKMTDELLDLFYKLINFDDMDRNFSITEK